MLLGLDNAGKTSMLYALEGRREEAAAPSWGFTTADVARGGVDMKVFDLGGGERIRGIWGEYLPEAHGAVFVVDAADAGRLAEAGEELRAVLADRHLEDKPLLVFANKQDLPGALPPARLVQEMGLAGLPRAAGLQVRGGSARKGGDGGREEGVREGLRWLQRQIAGRGRELWPRVEREAEAHREVEREKREERRRRVRAEKEKREAEKEREREEAGGLPPPPDVVQHAPPELDPVGPLSPRTPRSSMATSAGGGGAGGGAGAAPASGSPPPRPLEEDVLPQLEPLGGGGAEAGGGGGSAGRGALEVRLLEQELGERLGGLPGAPEASPLPGAVSSPP